MTQLPPEQRSKLATYAFIQLAIWSVATPIGLVLLLSVGVPGWVWGFLGACVAAGVLSALNIWRVAILSPPLRLSKMTQVMEQQQRSRLMRLAILQIAVWLLTTPITIYVFSEINAPGWLWGAYGAFTVIGVLSAILRWSLLQRFKGVSNGQTPDSKLTHYR